MSESDFRDRGAQDEAEQSSRRDEPVTGRDAGPVDDLEGMAAVDGLTASPGVAEHDREMSATGATVEGEGRIV